MFFYFNKLIVCSVFYISTAVLSAETALVISSVTKHSDWMRNQHWADMDVSAYILKWSHQDNPAQLITNHLFQVMMEPEQLFAFKPVRGSLVNIIHEESSEVPGMINFTLQFDQDAHTFTAVGKPFLLNDEDSTINRDADEPLLISRADKHTDWDKEEFQYLIKLNNGKEFVVHTELEALIGNKLRENMPIEIIGEAFLPKNPGFSQFHLKPLDSDFEFVGVSRSVITHWEPSVEDLQSSMYVSNYAYGDARSFGVSLYEIDSRHRFEIGQMRYYFDAKGEKARIGDTIIIINPDLLVNWSKREVYHVRQTTSQNYQPVGMAFYSVYKIDVIPL